MMQQWRTVLFGIGFLLFGSAVVFAQTPGPSPHDPDLIRWVVGGAILILTLILFGVLANFFWLQRRLLQDCITRGAIGDYLKLPMGVPEGTIRGIITFVIVVVSLVILVVQIGLAAAGKPGFTFPETLSAILGTVIAFYFGSRTGGGTREPQNDANLSASPVEEGLRTEHHALAGKITQGLNAATKISDFLPESLLPTSKKEKVQKAVTAAKAAVASAQTLLATGKIDAAGGVLTTAKEMLASANPAVSILKGALKTFSSVLPQGQSLLFLTALLAGGGSLAGQAYQSWKRRILGEPFEAADFPVQAISATTALGLYAKDETLKKIFETEISQVDFAGLLRSFRDILNASEPQSLVAQYQSRIEAAGQTPERFLQAVDRMKKAFMDQYLEDVIDGSALREIGGLAPFMEATQTINGNEEAQKEMKKVMEVDEQMKKSGQDPHALIELVEASR